MDRDAIRQAAEDADQIAMRQSTAHFIARLFLDVGIELHVTGHFIGDDRRSRKSPFGHGDDETVAISMLLRIGGQLVSGSADLICDGRHYAGSALIRQLVEVEYLAWAFGTRNNDAANWLRSSRKERKDFFSPAKLRKAAESHFRSTDYGYHCELGGHPVPGSWMLLNDDTATAQLMLSDCIGHAGQIWNHVGDWAQSHSSGESVLRRSLEMAERYARWNEFDLLARLPPPPEFPPSW